MEMSVTFKTDPDGFTSQQCKKCNRYFKIKYEKDSKNKLTYCPYCKIKSDSFLTTEQIEHAKDVVSSKVILPMLKGFGNSLKTSSKFLKVKSSYKCNPHAIAPIENNKINKIVHLSCCNEQLKLVDSWDKKVYCIICGKEYENIRGKIKMNPAYRDFEKSYKRVKDYAENVLSSDYNNFKTNLNIFINYVEKDGFFSPIAKQLNNHPKIIDGWWKKSLESRSSMVGSGKLELPDDEEERLALLYQLCKSINSGEIDITSVAMTFFYESKLNSMVQKFNEIFFTPFLKLFEYRIDEVEEKVREENNIGNKEKYEEVIKTVINVHGDNKGIISTGENTQNVQINNEQELFDKIAELKNLDDVKGKTESEQLVEEIIELSKKNDDKVSIVQKLESLIKKSPSVKSKLKQIAFNVGIGISSNVVIEGIKFLLGI